MRKNNLKKSDKNKPWLTRLTCKLCGCGLKIVIILWEKKQEITIPNKSNENMIILSKTK
jgi:hypothetical protein